MVNVHVELLVEPFKENEPGPHVHAAFTALTSAGLEPEMGPFATTATGEIDGVIAALGDAIRDAIEHGASSLQIRVDAADA